MARSHGGQQSEQPRVALLSGAASDIGRATAQRLAQEGLAVVLCDDGRRPLDEVLTTVRDLGGRGLTIEADVTNETEVDDAVLRAFEWDGRLDVLVNCPDIDERRSGSKADRSEWEPNLRVNLRSVFLYCSAVTPYMRMRRYGKIVNVASSAGRYRSSYFHHSTVRGGRVAYAAAQGGVLALTRELAFEVAPDGIYVNAVVPGLIATAELAHEWSMLPEEDRKDMLAETALGRLGSPAEVAAVISFLASDASSYVTGTALDVNGGWWMS